MIRSNVVITSLLSLSVFAVELSYIPEQYRELLPPELKEFLISIRDEDEAVLKEIYKNSTEFANEDEFVAEVTKKSADLGARFKKVDDMFKRKVDALKPEAQAFAKHVIERIRNIRSEVLKDHPKDSVFKEAGPVTIKKFKELSDEAKEDFKKEFPFAYGVFSSKENLKRVEPSTNAEIL